MGKGGGSFIVLHVKNTTACDGYIHISRVRGLGESSKAKCQGSSCPGIKETTEVVFPGTSFGICTRRTLQCLYPAARFSYLHLSISCPFLKQGKEILCHTAIIYRAS